MSVTLANSWEPRCKGPEDREGDEAGLLLPGPGPVVRGRSPGPRPACTRWAGRTVPIRYPDQRQCRAGIQDGIAVGTIRSSRPSGNQGNRSELALCGGDPTDGRRPFVRPEKTVQSWHARPHRSWL